MEAEKVFLDRHFSLSFSLCTDRTSKKTDINRNKVVFGTTSSGKSGQGVGFSENCCILWEPPAFCYCSSSLTWAAITLFTVSPPRVVFALDLYFVPAMWPPARKSTSSYHRELKSMKSFYKPWVSVSDKLLSPLSTQRFSFLFTATASFYPYYLEQTHEGISSTCCMTH